MSCIGNASAVDPLRSVAAAALATEQSSAPAHVSAYFLQAARMANLESSSGRRECTGGLDDILNDARRACDAPFIG
jgi:hypothetical protein